MHQADPNVKVIGPACTNEWFCWNRDFLGMFLRQTGHHDPNAPLDPSSPDGLSLHYYAGSTWSDSMGVAQTWSNAAGDYPLYIRATNTSTKPVRSLVVVTARRDNTAAGARAPFVVYPRDRSTIHAARAASALREHSRAHAR